MEVHRDVCDIADEAHVPVEGRDVDILVDVGAVETSASKSSVSTPFPPSTVSLPSPGFHTKTSSPAPSDAGVVAASADDQDVPWLPNERSLPPTAIDGEAQCCPAWEFPMHRSSSLLPRPLMINWSVASEMQDVDRRRRADDKDIGIDVADAGIVSLPAVPLTVTVSSSPSPTPERSVPSRSTDTPLRTRSVPVTSLMTMCLPRRERKRRYFRRRRDPSTHCRRHGRIHATAIGRDVDVLAELSPLKTARQIRPGL